MLRLGSIHCLSRRTGPRKRGLHTRGEREGVRASWQRVATRSVIRGHAGINSVQCLCANKSCSLSHAMFCSKRIILSFVIIQSSLFGKVPSPLLVEPDSAGRDLPSLAGPLRVQSVTYRSYQCGPWPADEYSIVCVPFRVDIVISDTVERHLSLVRAQMGPSFQTMINLDLRYCAFVFKSHTNGCAGCCSFPSAVLPDKTPCKLTRTHATKRPI